MHLFLTLAHRGLGDKVIDLLWVCYTGRQPWIGFHMKLTLLEEFYKSINWLTPSGMSRHPNNDVHKQHSEPCRPSKFTLVTVSFEFRTNVNTPSQKIIAPSGKIRKEPWVSEK